MAHRRKRKKTADYYNYVLYNLNILTMISLFFLVSLEKFIWWIIKWHLERF